MIVRNMDLFYYPSITINTSAGARKRKTAVGEVSARERNARLTKNSAIDSDEDA
jgi:hypothetical protein